ncbi:MAG: SDR family NAD(P)-dependent oxidoreductase [Burkholderiales bacterium]|nr:MAG: SDR family NAD(P)-dependent oxidoreductase [Burkholderiales bacterium]
MKARPMPEQTRLFLISGGSRGLGEALMMQYRAAGWSVVEWSRSGKGPEHRHANFAELASSPPDFDAQIARLADDVWSEVVCVNNAAQIDPVGPAGELDDAALVASINLNFSSGLRFMTSFLRHFGSHPGRRVLANISSGAATRPIPGWSLYCAAKAGTEHFIRSVASEQADRPNPVQCVNINPGVMDTNMQKTLRAVPASRFPLVQRFLDLQRDGQLRRPEDIARRIGQILDGKVESGSTYDATR